MTRASISMATWLIFASASAMAGDPALPGNHPLTQSQAGELLISELRCSACHERDQSESLLVKTAPDLAEVGSRVAPEYLQKFLLSPSAVHIGTTMPDVLATQPEAERQQIATALTHFLIAQSQAAFQPNVASDVDREQGRLLFHSVGCVACHGPREVIPERQAVAKRNDEFDDEELSGGVMKTFPPIAVNLEHVAAKYSPRSLSEFLFQPLRVRHSGRMPDMKLTPVEAEEIAAYLIGDEPPARQVLQPEAALVAQGQQYFRQLNCAACHALPGYAAAPPVSSLNSAEVTRGCLSSSSERSPRFQLKETQVQAIVAALQEKPDPASSKRTVALTLTAFRCIACHVRDDFGGVPEAYDPHFVGTELKMGDDGRIPPPLTLVGAKLQPAWLKKVLFDGESVRPYMTTRMPQYGAANLQHLPALFAELDVMPGREMRIPNPESRTEAEREREKLLRAAGRELLGDKGLNCIACHNFNGKPAPVNQGIDLLTTYPRLRPEWFDAYVRDPMEFRPRTIMPSAWSNGVASHKSILDGDVDLQIEAVWYYLSLGTSAADPPGIRGISTRLLVDNVTRIHRGRSRVAGFRGIAVGFPQKLNYAFNAETGTLSALWTGDFVGVNWNGQGSGDFNPAGDPILFAQDVSFAFLPDDQAPWPLMPVMTKQAKVNPDPLYPKNLGYQFRGYVLDDASIPTFLYRISAVDIEDRSVATEINGRLSLKRVLRFQSPAPQTVWFRALTGELHPKSDRVFQNSQLKITVPEAEATLRVLSDEPRQSELLLRLSIPQGESTVEVVYEPVNQ